MSWPTILVAFAALSGGCAAAACELMHHNRSYIEQCKADAEASAWGEDQRGSEEAQRRERAQKADDVEREIRAQAGPTCARGDAHACLTVAIYDERHHGSRATIARAYAVACRAELAFGCYGAGRFESDPARAVSLLAHGCELGEVASCDAAAEAAPSRATKFLEAACHLTDYDACEVAGSDWLYGRGVPVDRVHAWTLLERGCYHGVSDACDLLHASR